MARNSERLLTKAGTLVRAGRIDEGLAIARAILADDPARQREVAEAGAALGAEFADEGFCLAEVAVDFSARNQDWVAAQSAIRTFLVSVPNHIPALMRLVDLCAEAHLEEDRHAAELQLADAYIHAGSAAEALFIAEDLVARDGANASNLDTLRRALVLSGEPDPDAVLAQRTARRSAVADIESRAFQLGRNAVDIHDIIDDGSGPAAPIDAPLSADAISSPEKDLDTVFAEMRAEAAGRTAQDHADELYRQGLTLFERGQVDEAIAPLTAAAREARFRFKAAALLGRIHKQRDMPADAVDWFERAAEAPAPTVEEGHRLLYELADLLESSGEIARALALYMELQAEAANFEDVPQRIARLKSIEGRG